MCRDTDRLRSALRDLLEQIESVDGTAQLDTSRAEALLNEGKDADPEDQARV